MRFFFKRAGLTALVSGAVSLCASTSTPVQADVLYVSNIGGWTVQRFNTAGGPGSTFASRGVAGPAGIAFDSMGNLDVANYAGNNIEHLTPLAVGSVLPTSILVTNPEGSHTRGLIGPSSLAFDSAGNLYVTDTFYKTIDRFTPAGVGSVFANTGTQTPGRLAFDHAGNLYASFSENIIERYSPAGVGSVFASTGLSNPVGLAFDSSGNLYVANGANNTIEEFTSGGIGSVFASSGLNGPTSLAFDSLQNLYVVNNRGGTIEKFTPAGVGSVFVGSGLSDPEGIAFTNDAGVPLPLPSLPEPSTCALLCLCLPALRRRPRRH